MKENAPHGLLWRGFWEGLGAGLAAIVLLWIPTHITGVRDTAIDAVFGLVPPYRLVWPTSIALCLVGVGCFLFALCESFNQEIFKAAARIRAGTATDQDLLMARVIIEHKKDRP